ncbi:TIGR04222 domain-containing membrane protein [Streptomyces sp. NPDC005794]|uniref:TIGR04222 domain-containing membrane protein n=1 Tax=Streptomyces sp. NPDC005794 TaxID=3364733 RepID=UPI0036AB1ADF
MNALAVLLTLAVAVSSTLLIIATRRSGRRPGAGDRVHDRAEAAFLAGGPARVVDTALTALHVDGRLAFGGPGIVAVYREEARDPVERAVFQELATAPSGALHTLREAVMRHQAVQEIGDGLAARGLLVAPDENRSRRRWATTQGVVCVVAFPLALAATVLQSIAYDDYADVPFPFIMKILPALVAGVIIGFVTAASAKRRITRAGRRALDDFRIAHAQVGDPAHLVATRGLRALPDPVLQGWLVTAARQRSVRHSSSVTSTNPTAALIPVVWCAGASPGGGSCGSSSGGGGDSGSGSTCSSGSSCGSSGGSSCSSGSSCGSSSGSSCGGGSSCGSSS